MFKILLTLLVSVSAFAQTGTKTEPAEVLATCTDQGHQFESVVISVTKSSRYYLADIVISYADDRVKKYNAGIIGEEQMKLFRTTTQHPIAFIGLPPVDELELDENENILNGLMLHLRRIYDDPKPYIDAYISIGGKIIELSCQ